MNQKVIKFNKNIRSTKKMPDIQAGDIVRVHKRIKEGDKERVQVFKGLVIAVKGRQSSSPMITVRRESQKIGVEMTFPLFLPTIEKVEVLRHSRVRQSKIYYMRGRSGKSARMKVRDLTEEEKAAQKPVKKTKDENPTGEKPPASEDKENKKSEKKTEKQPEEKISKKEKKSEEVKEVEKK